MSERNWWFTSESVTEGHPDKVADSISDAVLDAALAGDPHSRVACEVLVTTKRVIVAGEIASETAIDADAIAREVIAEIGYDGFDPAFSADTVDVEVLLDRQSPEIAQGVIGGAELGAGDQGIMFGFAVDETDELMPLPIQLAHRLAERLAAVRKLGVLDYLRPDGKTQVSVEYRNDRPLRVTSVLISAHHGPGVDVRGRLAADLMEHVVRVAIPPDLLESEPCFYVNPTGSFEIGGPHADTGLTGRKIIVDTYGGYARHGGGAFSGKDPTKVDRSAAYAARHAAKTIVAAGLARKCEVQLAYAIGRAEPFSIHLETFGTEQVDPGRLESMLGSFFDFRPAAIIERLDLRTPRYRRIAAYGHFGRPDLPWESTDRAAELAAAAGL
ncbi:MAG: methionine adenosyltransferase [Acidimicrobiia bacterium]|jgi:S-adenosylmethionine synthetase